MLFILFCRYFGMFKMLLVLLVLETTERDTQRWVLCHLYVLGYRIHCVYDKISLSYSMVSPFKCCEI